MIEPDNLRYTKLALSNEAGAIKKLILSLFGLSLVGTAAHAQTVDTLQTKTLPEAPVKEIHVITVN
jgi:hypothetical protein